MQDLECYKVKIQSVIFELYAIIKLPYTGTVKDSKEALNDEKGSYYNAILFLIQS